MTVRDNRCPVDGGQGLAETDYRNLFGNPQCLQDLYRGLQPPVPGSENFYGDWTENRKATRAMLEKLAARMSKPFNWGDTTPLPAGVHNLESNVPAGYTYFAQLVAHDMVQSVSSLDAVRGHEGTPRNYRRAALVLDTIYGGGPLATPLAYALGTDRSPAQRRVRLRLSRSPKTRTRDGFSHRDLARASTSEFLNDEPATDLLRSYFRDALVADPRNDDNMFVSQLAVVFHILHNVLFDHVDTIKSRMCEHLRPKSALHQFRIVRQIVVRLYRQIVREDLLERILDPDILATYQDRFKGTRAYLDSDDDGRMPVEFSHAAFRFGHAMVRPHYFINDRLKDFSAKPGGGDKTGNVGLESALQAASDGDTAKVLPFERNWWVQWSKFFCFPDSEKEPQKAMRIAPAIAEKLRAEDLVAHFDHTDNGGLPYRDLVRSAEIGARTVASLYDAIPEDFFAAPPVLRDPGERQRRIERWLRQHPEIGFTEEEISSISGNPPLAFYVLFEAAVEADGESLGALGSIIVAETIFGALSRSRSMFEDSVDLDTWCQALFDGPAPEKFPDLITYVNSREVFVDFI